MKKVNKVVSRGHQCKMVNGPEVDGILHSFFYHICPVVRHKKATCNPTKRMIQGRLIIKPHIPFGDGKPHITCNAPVDLPLVP